MSEAVATVAEMEPSFQALPDMLAGHAAGRPDARALLCGNERRTWGDLYRRFNRVANGLIGLGVRPGDKVAILGPPSIAYVETFLGTLAAGACAVPLSSMAAADSLALMLEDCDAKVLLIAAAMRELVEPFAGRLGKLLPGGRIAFDFESPGWTAYEPWLAAASDRPPGIAIRPEDGFNIIYSSGTTGAPKGILHSHHMRWTQVTRRVLGYGPDSVTLVSTPLYSNTTLVALLPTLAYGGLAILMAKFDAERYLQIAAAEHVTHTMLVPVQYERLLARPDFDSYDLSAFRMKLSTSAPLREQVKRAILKRWPGQMIEYYGLTEGGATCSLNVGENPNKLHTVGKPAPGCDVRVIDEAGRELPQGSVGELVGRSPGMMTGYYNRPDKTREIYWHAPDGTLFYRSGDLGRFDEDGFVQLLDRKKDMIISGGFNIYAADLEAVLSKHPAVADVAVIAVPSREWGETPLALVVLAPGAAIAADTLRDWANARLGRTQRISAVEFRDSLPRSSIGKILKRELREPYLRRAG